jgi:hypothetical protein
MFGSVGGGRMYNFFYASRRELFVSDKNLYPIICSEFSSQHNELKNADALTIHFIEIIFFPKYFSAI